MRSVLFMQVDLEMLNVSLGTGTLEIHSALLNTDYLDAQLVSAAMPLAQDNTACSEHGICHGHTLALGGLISVRSLADYVQSDV